MITRRDNGDGTTTFRGVEVTIPTETANKYDVIAVRKALAGDVVECMGQSTITAGTQCVFPILALRPTWKPPASLMPGEYRVQNGTLRTEAMTLAGREARRQLFRDFVAPSKEGRWRVNEDGTATYLGEK